MTFSIGFWHPVGPHGRETPAQIIQRKRGEIAANGWTLWSFQYRRPVAFQARSREVSANGQSGVFAFCSDRAGAVDPANVGDSVNTTNCCSYQLAGQDLWQPIPPTVRVPHPFRGTRRVASAFVVQGIVFPVEQFTAPTVEWLWLSKGTWRQDAIPTRGEYLIRPGGIEPIRAVRALLELRAPYLA
jgi:hypothetical protein